MSLIMLFASGVLRRYIGMRLMGIRIPLLKATQLESSEGHMYPFQIALQTSEFIQASIFHTMFSNMATAEFSKMEGAMDKMERKFTAGSFSKQDYDHSWKCLSKYIEVFRVSTVQSVLVSMNSHWDWYIRKLSDFISHGRGSVDSPELNSKLSNDFKRIGNSSISHQLNTLQSVTGVKFDIEEKDIENITEISLVRNLGMHNRWEVDARYLEKSPNCGLEVGELRVVPFSELFSWHSSFINVLHETCRKISRKYVDAPRYPI